MLAFLQVFLISMVPLIELRGAIPWGVIFLKLPIWEVVILSIFSNIILIPLIYICLVLGNKLLSNFKFWQKFWAWMVARVHKKFTEKYYKAGLIGLCLFVAVPLPGTGAWTGTIAGYVFGFRKRDIMWSVGGGVVIAGIAISLLTFGLTAI